MYRVSGAILGHTRDRMHVLQGRQSNWKLGHRLLRYTGVGEACWFQPCVVLARALSVLVYYQTRSTTSQDRNDKSPMGIRSPWPLTGVDALAGDAEHAVKAGARRLPAHSPLRPASALLVLSDKSMRILSANRMMG
jgi:hypothetical protein